MTVNAKHLFDFEGYGPSNARYVFVGLQEKVDKELQLSNIGTRISHTLFRQRRVDRIVALEALIESGGVPKTKARPDAVYQWAVAARIVAGLEGTTVEREYERLGAADGITWLTEALPIPMYEDTQEAWRAVPLPAHEKPRWDDYRTCEMQRTRSRLRAAIESDRPPEIIIAYGKGIANELAAELAISVSRIRLGNGSYIHFAVRMKGTIVIGTPFFGKRTNCFGCDDALLLVEYLREMRKTSDRPHEGTGAKAEAAHGMGADVKETGTRRRRQIVGAHSSNDPKLRSPQMDRTQFMNWAEATLAMRLGVSNVHREDGNVQHPLENDVHIGIVATTQPTTPSPSPCIRVHIWTHDLRRIKLWESGWRTRGTYPDGLKLEFRIGDRGNRRYLEFSWRNSDLNGFQRWLERVEQCMDFFVAARAAHRIEEPPPRS